MLRVTHASLCLASVPGDHMHTYRQLMRLDADFAAGGPLQAPVRTSFGWSSSEAYLRDGQVKAGSADCDNP